MKQEMIPDEVTYTGGEERVLGTSEAELLEDDWRVVVNGLDTRESLEEDETDTEQNTVSVSRRSEEILGKSPKADIPSNKLLSLNLLLCDSEFVLNVGVVGRHCKTGS